MPEWKARNTKRARTLRNQATPAERAVWRYLARSALGAKFSRQMPVGPYFADFLCRDLKLAVKLDGHSHDVAPERDIVRDGWLREHGYTVLHFTNFEVLFQIEAVVAAIKLEVERLKTASEEAHP